MDRPVTGEHPTDLHDFAAQLRATVGNLVRHKGGSAGVYERTPNGTPTELWSYGNAVAYSGAVREILELLDAAIAAAGSPAGALPPGHPAGQFQWSAFGANYPDTTCAGGVCSDLDDDGRTNGEIPCPFCRPVDFFEHQHGGTYVFATCAQCHTIVPWGAALRFHDGPRLTATADCPACGPDQAVMLADHEAAFTTTHTA